MIVDWCFVLPDFSHLSLHSFESLHATRHKTVAFLSHAKRAFETTKTHTCSATHESFRHTRTACKYFQISRALLQEISLLLLSPYQISSMPCFLTFSRVSRPTLTLSLKSAELVSLSTHIFKHTLLTQRPTVSHSRNKRHRLSRDYAILHMCARFYRIQSRLPYQTSTTRRPSLLSCSCVLVVTHAAANSKNTPIRRSNS